jgi:nucleoside permease NupC
MILQVMAGLLFFVLIAWSSSENRKQVRLSTIAGGLGLQFVLAFTLLKIRCSRRFSAGLTE